MSSLQGEPQGVPPDCADPTMGKMFWEMHAQPGSVTDESWQLALLKHPAACPACLGRVLEEFHREGSDDNASGTG